MFAFVSFVSFKDCRFSEKNLCGSVSLWPVFVVYCYEMSATWSFSCKTFCEMLLLQPNVSGISKYPLLQCPISRGFTAIRFIDLTDKFLYPYHSNQNEPIHTYETASHQAVIGKDYQPSNTGNLVEVVVRPVYLLLSSTSDDHRLVAETYLNFSQTSVMKCYCENS